MPCVLELDGSWLYVPYLLLELDSTWSERAKMQGQLQTAIEARVTKSELTAALSACPPALMLPPLRDTASVPEGGAAAIRAAVIVDASPQAVAQAAAQAAAKARAAARAGMEIKVTVRAATAKDAAGGAAKMAATHFGREAV